MVVKIAVVQAPPVLLDRSATIARMIEAIDAAAAGGANLVVFPEAYLPGYPTWAWRLKPGADMALAGVIHARLRDNAIDLTRGGLKPLTDAARAREVTVVAGLHELDGEFSGSTLFNTVVVIGPDGAILNRHRKLVPTNPERMVWGRGDGRGLRVVDTPAGRLGTLLCWEAYMPLARYALFAQGIELLVVPTWDCGAVWTASMRHIAREGGCFVIATATAIQGKDVPAGFPERQRLFPDAEEWICDGDALIVSPLGEIVAGPLHRDKAVLTAAIEPGDAARARRSLDITGHYARPDIFTLTVNRAPMQPVDFADG